MIIGVRPTWLLCSISLLAAACSGSTIHEIENLGRDKTLVTSTDVRVINRIPVRAFGNGRVIPESISCAEPSPDVAKAVSESFNLSGSFETGFAGPGVSPNVAAAMVNARSEAIAQLTQRLATIQLLRDGLYRACEAYANGAINSTTYAVILSRFDDTMVTMLMGELAAGNFGGRMAGLGTAAGGSASAQLISSYQELIEAALSEDSGPQPEGTPPGEETTQPTGQSPSGDNRSLDRQSNLQAIASGLTETSRVIAAENLNARQDPDVARVIGRMQRKYLENINFDAMVVACINSLDNGGVEADSVILAYSTYRQASEQYRQDPSNPMKKAARNNAERAYNRAVFNNGKMSPLGWHCLGDVMPRIAEGGFELLRAITDRAAREREVEESAKLLKRHADAIFGLRYGVKTNEFRLEHADSFMESATEQVESAKSHSKSARMLLDAQSTTVRNLQETVAEKASLKTRAAHEAMKAAQKAELAQGMFDARKRKHEAEQKKAEELAAAGASKQEEADAAAKAAAASLKAKNEAQTALETATADKELADATLRTAEQQAAEAMQSLSEAWKRLEQLQRSVVDARDALRSAEYKRSRL